MGLRAEFGQYRQESPMGRAGLQAQADWSFIPDPLRIVCVTWAMYPTFLNLSFPICKTFYLMVHRDYYSR